MVFHGPFDGIVAHVADFWMDSVGPHGVRGRTENSGDNFAFGNGWVEPKLYGGRIQYNRHPSMNCGHEVIGSTGDDGAAGPRIAIRCMPVIIETRKSERGTLV